MNEITLVELLRTIRERDIRRWTLRECSMCGRPLYYIFENPDEVWFSSACDCVRYESAPEPRTWDEVLRCFNMQTPEIRARMWAEFVASGQKR